MFCCRFFILQSFGIHITQFMCIDKDVSVGPSEGIRNLFLGNAILNEGAGCVLYALY